MRAIDPPTADWTLAEIKLPVDEPVTAEEIERRRALFAKVMAVREQIGPIGIRADELIHQSRDEADAIDE